MMRLSMERPQRRLSKATSYIIVLIVLDGHRTRMEFGTISINKKNIYQVDSRYVCTISTVDTYMEAFVQYLHEKHGDARRWRVKHVRYFDISKLRYFDISKL